MIDWEFRVKHLAGLPQPIIYLHNVRALPLGDGILRLLVVDHPLHAACWDVLEEHGIGREVVLHMDKTEYLYHAEIGDDDAVYLIPVHDENDDLPSNDLFLRKAFNLQLRW